MSATWLLSICIPTRNRPAELSATLRVLLSQIERGGHSDRVQIVVSDNTDTESCRLDISPFSSSNFKYSPNRSDIGYARNVIKVISEADGKYVWLLSDDDTVLDGAVEEIVAALKSDRELNYLTFYTGASFQGKLFSDNFYFKDLDRTYFDSGGDFLARYWMTVIFISDNIYDRAKLLRHSEESGFLNELNDVYQNSLMGISFIEKYGKVAVIPKTLLVDNYGRKAYSRRTAIDAPVHQYIKLWRQLSPCVGGEAISQLRRSVESSIIRNGLRFAVNRIETGCTHTYREDFVSIAANPALPVRMRLLAFCTAALLTVERRFARFLIKSASALFPGRIDYESLKAGALEFERDQGQNRMRTGY